MVLKTHLDPDLHNNVNADPIASKRNVIAIHKLLIIQQQYR